MKRETAYGLLVVSLLAFVLSFTVTWIKKAHGAAACLTKKEARQLWPRQHLYWYSANHCWSNRHGPPRNLRYDLIRENHAESLPAPAAPTVLYPSLQQMMKAIEPRLFDRSELTLSYRLLDIDELTSKVPDPPDECCWPELNPDGSLK